MASRYGALLFALVLSSLFLISCSPVSKESEDNNQAQSVIIEQKRISKKRIEVSEQVNHKINFLDASYSRYVKTKTELNEITGQTSANVTAKYAKENFWRLETFKKLNNDVASDCRLNMQQVECPAIEDLN